MTIYYILHVSLLQRPASVTASVVLNMWERCFIVVLDDTYRFYFRIQIENNRSWVSRERRARFTNRPSAFRRKVLQQNPTNAWNDTSPFQEPTNVSKLSKSGKPPSSQITRGELQLLRYNPGKRVRGGEIWIHQHDTVERKVALRGSWKGESVEEIWL